MSNDTARVRRARVFRLGCALVVTAAVAVMLFWDRPMRLAGAKSTSTSPRQPPRVGGGDVTAAPMRIECQAAGHHVSELIYGIAYNPMNEGRDSYLWDLNPGARRWGGNNTSRYNWQLGNAWNTAADWFFRNTNYTGDAGFTWSRFLDANREHHVGTALTMPMLGWVAKDTTSYSFPVSVFGEQEATDPYRPDAGNGEAKSGRELTPGPAETTSVRMPPESIEAWVKAIAARDQVRGGRSVQIYMLDNEPMLWSTTHRDVHPTPLSYDELRERTIAYASAIRRADPKALIAGPCEWGWPNYFYSAVDLKAGLTFRPDRRAHGDMPLLAWYLSQLREHEAKTGERLLDILDVHYYPQEIPKEAVDRDSRARRLRATRSLWDGSYHDESWIDDVVELVPRLAKLVDENYPGLGIAIGEYNFGGENDMSGALALAEALGRFTQQPRLTAAFYFQYPPKDSPASYAFRAFRNYDGHGGRFLSESVPTEAAAGTSLFASRDPARERFVAILLNLDPDKGRAAVVDTSGCNIVAASRAFRYEASGRGLAPLARLPSVVSDTVRLDLPSYSITILELETRRLAERRKDTPAPSPAP